MESEDEKRYIFYLHLFLHFIPVLVDCGFIKISLNDVHDDHSAVKSKYLPVKKIKSPMCQYIGWNSLHNKNFTIKIAYLLLNVKRYQFKL